MEISRRTGIGSDFRKGAKIEVWFVLCFLGNGGPEPAKQTPHCGPSLPDITGVKAGGVGHQRIGRGVKTTTEHNLSTGDHREAETLPGLC